MKLATIVLASLLLATVASAGLYTVTTTDDSGPGSLRDGILAANTRVICDSPCYIVFNLPPPVPPSGWFTIRPQSPLPVLAGWRAVIDGHSQTLATGDTNPLGPEIELDGEDAGLAPGLKIHFNSSAGIFGMAINRFGGNGVVIEGGDSNRVGPNPYAPIESQPSNYIGVDPTGTRALPNGYNGVLLIRTFSPRIEHNLISGNRGNGIFGVELRDGMIIGNAIGTGNADDIELGNGVNGIDMNGSTKFGGVITIAQNRIAYNGASGIATQPATTLVSVTGNTIFRNALMSLDVGHDGVSPNSIQPPLLTFANTIGSFNVHGVLHAAPSTNVHVELFASSDRTPLGLAEGRRFLGAFDIRTDTRGEARFDVDRRNGISDAASGEFVAATATTIAAGTSELSDPLRVQ
ncbi:MAG: parallel beta-helix repeat protein [Acidobacteria bacterium]|nr:parallel beta-helix repeat protein [Acidobacteriota bacterium]